MAKKMAHVVPPHLREHIAKQNYKLYTAIDHASWRFIMRISKAFFKNHAHEKYLRGLELTGITIDRIPRITEMDKKLKKFGWGAVTVTGFIPPAAFLEFQSLSILPIACDMRRLEHLDYTPSPDIVHEAAGHAPIIADKKYAAYLHKFGEIARKAIFAKEDIDVYDAVKYLSDIKEDPATTQEQVAEAYRRLAEAHKRVTYASEATKLSRLGWWSTEYGLVKKGKTYKIYGAGLLSSVGESYNAVVSKVRKVPLTLGCTDVDFDITKPQPQLFYVEDFKELEKVIDELSATMAFKVGGITALERAQKAGTVTTTVFDTGLQVSGVLKNIVCTLNPDSDKTGRSLSKMKPVQIPIYLQYSGPVQLAHEDRELPGHSPKYHAEGYGTPIGPIEKATPLVKNHLAQIVYRSGVKVEGIYRRTVRRNGVALLHTFDNCRVTYGKQIFFDPSWGTFDLACGGEKIISVFGGAADRTAYLRATSRSQAKPKVQTSNLTKENKRLEALYRQVRQIRERSLQKSHLQALKKISTTLDQQFHEDWLLRLEILELLMSRYKSNSEAVMLRENLNSQLDHLSHKSDVYATLIRRGRELISAG